mgnify:CR=1 FL=1
MFETNADQLPTVEGATSVGLPSTFTGYGLDANQSCLKGPYSPAFQDQLSQNISEEIDSSLTPASNSFRSFTTVNRPTLLANSYQASQSSLSGEGLSHSPGASSLTSDDGVGSFWSFSSSFFDAFRSLGNTIASLKPETEEEEVARLLKKETYDRDEDYGTFGRTREFTNDSTFKWWGQVTNSADESYFFDRGDSISSAIDLGDVYFRQAIKLEGNIGKNFWGYKDTSDFYDFTVAKEGDVTLSLSGLSQDSSLVLFDESGSYVTHSDRSGTSNEWISRYLGEGDYTAQVYNDSTNYWWSQAAKGTNYDLTIRRDADALEWKTLASFTDWGLERAVLNSIKHDSDIDRNDMIGILKSAGDGGVVDSTEFNELREFHRENIEESNPFAVEESVKVIAKKVLFDETSNLLYTGFDNKTEALGNLDVDSSQKQLDFLIGKHFLGTDRPASSGTYKEAKGSLFEDGVDKDDVDQGDTGTCYFLSSLAAAATDKPEAIQNMFTDNGDDTWTVRFFTNGKADYVTVDRKMAADASGNYIYADDGAAGKQSVASDNELWVALAEKAYAQINESNKIKQDGTNSYHGINRGWMGPAMTHITGLEYTSNSVDASSGYATTGSGITEDALINLVNSNRMVTAGNFNDTVANNSTSNPGLVTSAHGGHAWAVTGYNPLDQRFELRDPYANRHLSLNYQQLQQIGGRYQYTNS